MRTTQYVVISLFVGGCLGSMARAEFGVSVGASFHHKADFTTEGYLMQAPATDPGAPTGKQDRFYDDGYVRLDAIPGFPDLTRYYGYDDAASQVVNNALPADGGTIQMSSSAQQFDAQDSSGSQDGAQPVLEIYYSKEFDSEGPWRRGMRASLRWQQIEIEHRTAYRTSMDVLTDTYTYDSGSILVGGSYDGFPTPAPGFPALNDTPVSRSQSVVQGADVNGSRNLDTDLYALDLGPTFVRELSEKSELSTSVGWTFALADSTFSYQDAGGASGRDSHSKGLFGVYADADIKYQLDERWGIFTGVAYSFLQSFTHESDGYTADLDFSDAFRVRLGVYYR